MHVLRVCVVGCDYLHVTSMEVCNHFNIHFKIISSPPQDDETSQKLKAQLHAVLWNQGTARFQAKAYTPAQELFKAAMHFADGSIRAKAARTLAICALALKDHDRHAHIYAQPHLNVAVGGLNPLRLYIGCHDVRAI